MCLVQKNMGYLITSYNLNTCFLVVLDEYRGHTLLVTCANCDVLKMKKILAADIANFQHPFSLDSSLVRIANDGWTLSDSTDQALSWLRSSTRLRNQYKQVS